MKHFLSRFNFRNTRTFAILVGLAATIWFLIRVIPKPSRATYPCMRVAAPFMSSFIIYLLGISVSVFSFKKFRNSVKSARYAVASVFLGITFLSFALLMMKDANISFARSLKGIDATFPVPSNDPIGTAKGLHPGRVVWVHNMDATNKAFSPVKNSGNFSYEAENVDQQVVSDMLTHALKTYTGDATIGDAWTSIFTSFNETHGRGTAGYTAGEKIAIKINLTNQCCYEERRADASPQLVNALLYELTVNAGVAQSDIVIGDPYREFRSEYISLVKSQYPDVNYVDGNGGNGIAKTVPTSSEILVFSNGVYKSTLPQYYVDADYFINMPCFKTHNDGGITLIAKNHQGSFLPSTMQPQDQSAMAMHDYLPTSSPGTGKYRHIVDYMSHEQTGGKGLIYIIDGIWGGESWEGYIKKFFSDPFANDYPNSIFVGQDPVALESVCFDILFEEYALDTDKGGYPVTLKNEIADGLKQMASSDYWPAGITYDPEDDGSAIESQGVFEHWNNATDRKYTRNLGTGNGIELLYTNGPGGVGIENYSADCEVKVGPNPFSDYTEFTKPVNYSNNSILSIYNVNGQLLEEIEFNGVEKVTWNGTDARGSSLSNGMYLFTVSDLQNGNQSSGKVVLNR